MRMLDRTTDETDELDPIDREALERSVAVACADPIYRKTFVQLRAQDGWLAAAVAASYHCQYRALDLRPWQEAPAVATGRDRACVDLQDRLIDASLSVYEPDPLRALAKVRRGDRLEN